MQGSIKAHLVLYAYVSGHTFLHSEQVSNDQIVCEKARICPTLFLLLGLRSRNAAAVHRPLWL